MFLDNMSKIPTPIFKKDLSKISWKKIYEREYGVQYSEVAVSLLAGRVKDHFPKTSIAQIIVPGQVSNTAFYIDGVSWVELVEGLNQKYTSNVKNLKQYEKRFLFDGENYLTTARKIHSADLKKLTDHQLKDLYEEYQEKLYLYSTFAWSAFILNNYVSERATGILDNYIKKANKEVLKQEIHDALFRPEKRAAILELQHQVEKYDGKLDKRHFEELHNRFKWLSCLDIHNSPWTKEEFKKHIASFTKTSRKKEVAFEKIAKQLKINSGDLAYLLMAKRFVYIKDARDDFRRQGVFYALGLFREIARRMKIDPTDISYLQEAEIIGFLSGKINISREIIRQRRKAFVMYLDSKKKLFCAQGSSVPKVLREFKLITEEKKPKEIIGRVASQGMASGQVVIVRGVKDLGKVKVGNVLVAVTTHPDYVPAMRIASAIVTDEGGITSHAAIVSREFGIPCIVGTKNATLTLKEGNLVDVNAMEGKVTIRA